MTRLRSLLFLGGLWLAALILRGCERLARPTQAWRVASFRRDVRAMWERDK